MEQKCKLKRVLQKAYDNGEFKANSEDDLSVIQIMDLHSVALEIDRWKEYTWEYQRKIEKLNNFIAINKMAEAVYSHIDLLEATQFIIESLVSRTSDKEAIKAMNAIDSFLLYAQRMKNKHGDLY